MNGWLLAAAALSLFGCIGHIVIGERRFLPPFLASGIVVDKDAQVTADTLRGAWHVWALAYLMCAGLLGVFAFLPLDDGARITVWAIAGMFAVAFGMLLWMTKGKLPAVVLQLLIAVLAMAGLLVA